MKKSNTVVNKASRIFNRRQALSRLGLLGSAIYTAPVLLTLSSPTQASEGGSFSAGSGPSSDSGLIEGDVQPKTDIKCGKDKVEIDGVCV